MDNSSRRVGTRQPVAWPQRLAPLCVAMGLPPAVLVASFQLILLTDCSDQIRLVWLSLVQAQSVPGVPLALAPVLATRAPVQVPLPSASPFQHILVKSNPAAPPPTLAMPARSRPKRPSCRG